MSLKTIAERIIRLKEKDLELRNLLIRQGKLSQGYNAKMQALHDDNARELDGIIDLIGYPTIDKVGEEASEAAWLIIQHAIGQPEFMRKCAKHLEKVVSENRANPKNFAYLTDRIAAFEGKPQLFGTSFDWDDNGELSPNPYDDLKKVNQRRRKIGLNTLQEQTEVLRRRAKKESQQPPRDLEKRKHDFDEWRKEVGWTN